MIDLARPRGGPLLDQLSGATASFRRWWSDEFHALLSNRTGRWLLGPGRKTVRLTANPDDVELALDTGDQEPILSSRIGKASYSTGVLDDFLQTHRLSRADVDIAVRLPFDHFFGRKLLLPREALANLDDVMARDMARKTPFRLNEVYQQSAVAQPGGSDKTSVWQWIIKRTFVDDTLSRLQLDFSDVAFVDAASPSADTPAPFISLRQSRDETMWYWSTLRLLLLGAAILTLVAVGAKLWRQQSVLDELDAQIAGARAKAQQVRAQVDTLEKKRAAVVRVRTEKGSVPGLLDLWEKTTATLPAHSWLTELQLAQTTNTTQQVTVIGFSEAAASLVGLFEKSSTFRDASLTSPISLDPVENRERFSIQMKVSDTETGRSTKP